MKKTLVLIIAGWAPAAAALGQSSSLFLNSQASYSRQMAASTQPAPNGTLRANAGALAPPPTFRNVALASSSLTAIPAAEPRIIQPNDLITVIVRHRLRYQTDTRMQQQSRWDLKSKLSAWFRIHDRKLEEQDFERGVPEVNFKNQNDLKNQGRADRKDVFETRVMAKVLDVKPNGNLMLVGYAHVKIDEEDQIIRLTGECNKEDIQPDRSILSDKIFALDVQTENAGAMKDAAKRGWLKGLLDNTKAF
ncbi:MAG TPA: flagellar basal body L-ring protein FlgH [Phycisphaerae bacterium]|nr:flagellar basal body L-ring protein FlgH [Phycisphaerae bacterium]